MEDELIVSICHLITCEDPEMGSTMPDLHKMGDLEAVLTFIMDQDNYVTRTEAIQEIRTALQVIQISHGTL
jgi:hypothetical protein